jgi:lipid-A-disaccharide synthase
MSRYLDRVLTLFQFESQYFDDVGLDSVFVGHPIVQSGAMRGDGVGFRTDNEIQQDTKLICILPGSRSIEVTKHLPIIERTLDLLSKKLNNFQIVLPLADDVATYVRSVVQTWPYRITFTEGNDNSKYNAFAASDVALACSGTVALELALADIPYVTIYKMSFLSRIVARTFVRLKYVNLINIILDKEVVPELLLENCKPHLILPHLMKALNDTEFRSKQRKNFKAALGLITVGGHLPSERAAQAILEVIAKKSVF